MTESPSAQLPTGESMAAAVALTAEPGEATSATTGQDAAPQRGAGPFLHVFAILLALAGGLLGIIAAFFQELAGGGGLLLPFVGAPIIEEALKPTGIYLLLLRWPRALRGRVHTAVLAALAGLSFAVVESLIYVTLYFPEGSDDFVLFRFTVPLALHVSASFLVGLGLDRGALDWAAGRARFPKRTRNFYVAGVLVHAVYNTLAVILTLTGVLDID